MSLIDKLFGKKKPEPPALPNVRGAIPHDLPLRLRLGGMVHFDRTMYAVAPGAMTEELPESYQQVQCYGHTDLDDGYALHRAYLDDHAFLQVTTCGGEVEAMKAFVYVEQHDPANLQAFREFVAGHEHLYAPRITYMGRQWERLNQGEPGRMPPMAFDETLYRGQPPKKDGELTHYAQLFVRHVPELQREEFLLVTAEDTGPNKFLVSYAVGIDVTQQDVDIT